MAAGANATLAALAEGYMTPWAGTGITLDAVNDAHLHWADYRDTQWGGYVPLGEAHNRLLRINILSNQIYFVPCVGSKSVRRLTRQHAVLRLLQSVATTHGLPDADFVMTISDRPTVPKHAVPAHRTPPPVFGYAQTPAHYSIPFPPVSFDPAQWNQLHARIGTHPPLAARQMSALWRGTCNSLCDMMRGRPCRLPRDADLLSRQVLLRAAKRCPQLCDVGVSAAHRNCPGFPARDAVPIAQHSRHAFLLHVDGNGFSGRLDELLTLGGAVLKQASPFAAFYSPLLRAGVHYEPLWRNLSDVCSRVDALARGIDGSGRASAGVSRAETLAKAASAFARDFLSPPAIAQYVVALLSTYARMQRFQPTRHPDAVPWPASVPAHSKGLGRTGSLALPRSKPQRDARARNVKVTCLSASCCARHPKACRRQNGLGHAQNDKK